MSADELVERLLEELLESGRTVEEVCAPHPEQLDRVRQRWRVLRNLQHDLDELFPPAVGGDVSARPLAVAPLPNVPGYRLEREIGRGGMGIVYRALQERLQRPVALKMMLAGPFASPRELARFQREAELVAQLQHPNIVAVHDVGDVDGQPFFTMELVDGSSLAERLRAGPMPAGEAAAMVATVARAIDFAHQHGIVHRDLKPANILLAADGTPKVSDFGLARRIGGAGLTASGARIGTPSYMSPEQVAGHAGAIGPPTDVHALGAILYELLTGRPPYRAESDAETTRLVLDETPRPPRAIDAAIPRDLETICLQCLQKEPYRRYASAALLAADLERFRRGEPIAARRVGAVERTWRWARRRPGLALSLGVCALLAISLSMVATAAWRESSAQRDDVEAGLAAVRAQARAAQWNAAAAALRRAEARLAGGGTNELRRRVQAAAAELQLVSDLERVRVQQPLALDGKRVIRRGRRNADRDYAALLRDHGFAAPDAPAEAVADRVRASSIAPAIIAALDDWAATSEDPAQRAWLLAIARAADPDPGGWRDRARDPERWNDQATLLELAASADADRHPDSLLFSLAERMQQGGGDPMPFLKLAVAQHPQDFWLQLAAGLACARSNLDEAIRYLHAAVALRPGEASTHAYLGIALCARGRLTDGEASLRRAIGLDGRRVWMHDNLGTCLMAQRRFAEGLEAFQRGLELDPNWMPARIGAAVAHVELGANDIAMAELQAAMAIEPENGQAQGTIGLLLLRRGELTAALQHLDLAVRAAPESVEHHENRAITLNRLGRADDAAAAARRAAAVAADSHLHLAIAANVLREAGRIREAIAMMRQACALPDADAGSHTILGGMLAVDWQSGAAIAEFEAALRLTPSHAPALGGLAQALLLDGRFEDGLQAAARFVAAASKGDSGWAATLRRDAERLTELVADAEPGDEDVAGRDAIFLAAHCVRQGDLHTALRWYEAAFAREPDVADDVRGSGNLAAAAIALRAAGSLAVEGAAAVALRGKALAWMRGDLESRDRLLASSREARRATLIEYARRLGGDPRFAAVRDAAELFALPAGEREGWLAYWRDLAAWLRAAETR